MRRFTFLASAAGILAVALQLMAANSYPVKKDAGEWMILVHSYAGTGSQQLAEELCVSLRRDYNVAAYVFDRGEDERQKERERIAEVRRKMREEAAKAGLPADEKLPPVKTYRIEEQHAVLIGGWKDQATARKALDEVRKLKPPAEKFMDKEMVVDGKTANGDLKLRSQGINPFKTAFVVRNPLIPATVDPEQGKLRNLKEYNEGESYSLLKCRKPYTLIVKSYNGAVQVASAQDRGGFAETIGNIKPGQLLNASAQQAHALAEALQKIKDPSGKPLIRTDVYVLHTEHSSYVTIGGFDRPDDPELKQYQKTLAAMKLGPVDQLMVQPLPMPVPKP